MQHGLFYLSNQRSGQRFKSKNYLSVLSFEHLTSFFLKKLRHFSLREMFSRSSWWKRLGNFPFRRRINCWVPSPFRGRCCWSSIPIYHLLGSHCNLSIRSLLMSLGSMARSSMISPMTCPLFILISRESSRSISSTRKTETLWDNKHWVPDPKIQFEQTRWK